MRRIILIGGGVRSGKSSFAVDLALKLGERRVFAATATRSDDEMKARIDRHRRDRQEAFTTAEVHSLWPRASCGWAHQRVARVADDVYLAVVGAIVRIRPEFAWQTEGES